MRAYRKVKDHYEFRLDGGRLALLGVGTVLVLVLVFLLGVLVGKALWGGRRLPVAVPVEESAAPVPAPQADEPKVPSRPTYSFYEELKKPDPPPAPEPREERMPPKAEASGESAKPEREPPPERTAPPPAVPTPAPEPPAPKRAPAPVFTVQVGSFRDRNAAAQLADQVAVHGVQAKVVKAAVAGRTWYRVQVGRFDTRSEAEAHYRRRLKPRGVQGFVTTR